ncbi:MAG: prolipoprotein diacylglyceryl transferase [Eubacterium sp.]|nr:prolipoprotein diacylglyceryl transferase [Eubacterium sp.]
MREVAFPHLGIYIDHVPKSFSIFGLDIALYGVIIALGMIAGLYIACFQAKRTGQKTSIYTDFVIWGIVFSLIGARLYYVIFAWDKYKDNLLEIFNFRGGGLAIYGGVIAAVITVYVYCRVKKYSFFLFADTAVAGLILGQAIGRWGNFTNQEAFGEYTDCFLAMRLNAANVNPDYITDTMRANMQTIGDASYIQVHPTFLYESLWNIAVLLLMIFFTKKKKFDGEIFLMYLVGYGLGRAWIEGLRIDQLQIGSTGIAVSQVFSVVLVIGGIITWIIMRRRADGSPVVPANMSVNVSDSPDLSEVLDAPAATDISDASEVPDATDTSEE